MALYTGRGLGTTGVPIRIGSVPEVSEITLVRGEPGGQG
jgi:predicted MPP superfamily phosphohydrolase